MNILDLNLDIKADQWKTWTRDSTKMGADKSAENTPNAPKIFGPICLPKPQNLGFSKRSSLWVSIVCGTKVVATMSPATFFYSIFYDDFTLLLTE